MKVLETLGVTNQRLDEVSNYYRYQPQRGQLWNTTPAKVHAVVEAGKVKRIVVTDPGSGFSSPPKATITGMEQVGLKVTIQFSKELKANESISAVEVE